MGVAVTILDGLDKIRPWLCWILMLIAFIPLAWYYMREGFYSPEFLQYALCYVAGLFGFLYGLLE
jgi:hypothetical protein